MIRYTNSLGKVDDAVRRLEELNKWQEHQKKLLQERQNKQLQEFGIGKEITYEMLGITPLDYDLENKAGIGIAPNASIGESSGTCNEASKAIVTGNASAMCSPKAKLKKQFLRRGEGLKKRFKIDPNDLRINNLPRYKYAKVHSSLSKNTKPHATPKKVTKTIENLEEKNKELYNQERRFQQLFVSSNNIYNSTPDMKPSNANSTETEIKLLRVNDKGGGLLKYSAKCDTISNNVINTNAPISWAKVLDTQQIKPISVQQIRSAYSSFEVQDSDENLSIFELLEQKANEGSIDMNSSCIKRFMERKIQEDQDEIPVQSRLKTAGFLLNSAALESVMCADTDDNDDDDEDNASDGDQIVTNKLGSDCDSTLTSQQIGPKQITQVRFADVNNTHEYTEASSDTSSTVTNISSSFELFEQFKQALFSAINCKELSANDTNLQLDLKVNQSAPKLISVEDLQDVVNLVKTRLSELEKEIDTFKENNISLIKAKQQHEFEKTVFMQEQREAMNKLNDERIQIEIYLHDERMKLEDEKRTFQRQMLMQKSSSNSKERKEIAKLKEELEEMTKQLKQKDQAHIAAQARLRAQIRNLEKDQRQLCEDIDRLEKENKHLQNENLRISRETNNKMLQEINRNIVKLAPKLVLKKSNENSSDYFKDNTEAKHKKSKMKPKSTLNKNTLLKTTKINQLASTSSSDCEENTNGAIISKHIRFRGENVPLSTLEQTEKNIAPHSVTEGSKESSSLNDFKREIVNPDGSKDIWYSNGNLKKISSDGMHVRMLYFNKDIKETNINEGTVKYYYAETNTWHTSYLDGLEILEFPNGQTEHRYKNGVVEVHFPNNSVKISNPADEHTAEEWRFADGTNLKEMRNGDKILTLPNGQKEIHTKLNKRREYPDGTVKFVYPDGSQETRYSNGRVRLKDKDGQLIMDSENPQ